MLGNPHKLGNAGRLSVDEEIFTKACAYRPLKLCKKVVLAAQLQIHIKVTVTKGLTLQGVV